MIKLVWCEFIKQKKSQLASVIFLYPLFNMILSTVLVIFVYGGMNKVINSRKQDAWVFLLRQNYGSTMMLNFIVLFVTIIALNINYVEHSKNALREIMIMPVRRNRIYLAKFIVLLILVFVLVALCNCGIIASGLILGIREPIPFMLFLRESAEQFVLLLCTSTIQFYLSAKYTNPIVSITIGIIGMLIAIGLPFEFDKLGIIFPYSQVIYSNQYRGLSSKYSMMLSIAGCLLVLALSMNEYKNKDIL